MSIDSVLNKLNVQDSRTKAVRSWVRENQGIFTTSVKQYLTRLLADECEAVLGRLGLMYDALRAQPRGTTALVIEFKNVSNANGSPIKKWSREITIPWDDVESFYRSVFSMTHPHQLDVTQQPCQEALAEEYYRARFTPILRAVENELLQELEVHVRNQHLDLQRENRSRLSSPPRCSVQALLEEHSRLSRECRELLLDSRLSKRATEDTVFFSNRERFLKEPPLPLVESSSADVYQLLEQLNTFSQRLVDELREQRRLSNVDPTSSEYSFLLNSRRHSNRILSLRRSLVERLVQVFR